MSAINSDNSVAPEGIWHSLNRLLLTLIAVTVLTAIGYRTIPELGRGRVQETQIEALKMKIEHERQLLVRYQREESLLKNDPEYIGLIARDRLDLMKEGETIFRLEPSRPDLSRMRRKVD